MFSRYWDSLDVAIDTINEAIKHDVLQCIGFDDEGNAIFKVNAYIVDEQGFEHGVNSFVDQNNVVFLSRVK